MKEIWQIILRVLKFDRTFFKEIGDSAEMLTLSVIVVVLSSLAAGLGSISQVGIGGMVVGSIGALLNWAIWVLFTYLALNRLLLEKEKALSPRIFFISMGFASAPGIIKAAGIISPLHATVFIVSTVWMAAVMVKLIEADYSFKNRWYPVAAVATGWLAMFLIISLIGLSMKRLY